MVGTLESFLTAQSDHATLMDDFAIWHNTALQANECGVDGVALAHGLLMPEIMSFSTSPLIKMLRQAFGRIPHGRRERCDPRPLGAALIKIAETRERGEGALAVSSSVKSIGGPRRVMKRRIAKATAAA